MGNSRKLLDKPTWRAANMSVPGTDRSGTDGFWCTAALTFVQKGLQDRGQSQPHTLTTEGKADRSFQQIKPGERGRQASEQGLQEGEGGSKGKHCRRGLATCPSSPVSSSLLAAKYSLKSKSNQSSLYPSSLLPSLCAQNCQTSFLQPAR